MDRPTVAEADVVPYLLREATHAPELWHQKAYLGRVLSLSPEAGIRDEGILPIVHVMDAMTDDVVVMSVESDGNGGLYPVVYVRKDGRLEEHALPPDPLRDFATPAHAAALREAIGGLVPSAAAGA
jgi:hypothetical protein